MDMGSQLLRLLDGYPERGRKTGFHRRAPERQDIDPTVGGAIVPQRPDDLSVHVAAALGLDPWQLRERSE
jgi:hypothetical protein